MALVSLPFHGCLDSLFLIFLSFCACVCVVCPIKMYAAQYICYSFRMPQDPLLFLLPQTKHGYLFYIPPFIVPWGSGEDLGSPGKKKKKCDCLKQKNDPLGVEGILYSIACH